MPRDGNPGSLHIAVAVAAGLIGLGASGRAIEPRTLPAQPPTTMTGVGAWDAALVARAAALVPSAERWNKVDEGACPAAADTISIRCALERAVEESAGIWRDAAGKRTDPLPTRTACRFDPVGGSLEGSCGPLFDEVPVFRLKSGAAMKTGKWRPDAQPTQVWAGTMSDAEYPVMEEAAKTVGLVSGRKYAAPVTDYNNDPATTFTDVRSFFHQLQDQVATHAAADLDDSTDPVEIETYADGAGVIRTYMGWFPVSGLSTVDSAVRFQMDFTDEVPPNSLDREIIKRADAILQSVAVWNRADNRKCPATATTWSIYCAEERASVDVTGGFHHRRPALEIVRLIVEERTNGKKYQHRLMDYNNDPATRLEDVHSLFAEALARIK